MTLQILRGDETITKTIHDFNVVGNKLQVSIKKGESKTVEKSMWKQRTVISSEFEEENYKLTGDIVVSIHDGKNPVYELQRQQTKKVIK